MEKVYGLFEGDESGCHIHAVYKTRLAALKSMLALKRREVVRSLEDYKIYGWQEAEWSYRNCWRGTKLYVVEMEVYE